MEEAEGNYSPCLKENLFSLDRGLLMGDPIPSRSSIVRPEARGTEVGEAVLASARTTARVLAPAEGRHAVHFGRLAPERSRVHNASAQSFTPVGTCPIRYPQLLDKSLLIVTNSIRNLREIVSSTSLAARTSPMSNACPKSRDRVTGLGRPLAPRTPPTAATVHSQSSPGACR